LAAAGDVPDIITAKTDFINRTILNEGL